MKNLSRGLFAALLATAVCASPAFAVNATIRVEGYQKTLLAETKVVLDTAQVSGVSGTCPGNTVAGAIEKGTQGNWDHQSGVKTILGETHDFTKTYWSGWVAGKYSAGICDQTVNEGDEVIMVATEFVADENYRPRDWPITLHDVPARVARGAAFTVRVTEQVSDWQNTTTYGVGSGDPKPAAGAQVTIGSVTVTTDSAGKATLKLDQTGPLTAQAHRENRSGRSKPVPVCVSCDEKTAQQQAAGTGSTQTAAPVCSTNGSDGFCGTFDRQAPQAVVTGVREGQTFAAGRGPRELTGRVGLPVGFSPRGATAASLQPDPSGLRAVKLRLTRDDAGRCSAWSGKRERFVTRPCGARHGWWFAIGDKADWSYLLPARLGRGRYVLDVNAIDKAYNRDDTRRRGQNRVVFRVR